MQEFAVPFVTLFITFTLNVLLNSHVVMQILPKALFIVVVVSIFGLKRYQKFKISQAKQLKKASALSWFYGNSQKKDVEG